MYNCISVFGTNPCCWCLIVEQVRQPPMGTGDTFQWLVMDRSFWDLSSSGCTVYLHVFQIVINLLSKSSYSLFLDSLLLGLSLAVSGDTPSWLLVDFVRFKGPLTRSKADMEHLAVSLNSRKSAAAFSWAQFTLQAYVPRRAVTGCHWNI